MRNLASYKKRSLKRFVDAGLIVNAQMANLLDKAVAMSEQDRNEYISNFVNHHGLKETFLIIKRMVGAFTSKDVVAQIKQPLYEGFKNKTTPETGQPIATEETGSGKISQVLNKLGDWSVLLTFLLMYAAASTSDYHSLVIKQPGASAEIKAFLIAAGAGFMAWTFKYLAHLMGKNRNKA